METKDILKKLREDNNLTQDQMAEKLLVTRQAVSRWELGETQPNTDTLFGHLTNGGLIEPRITEDSNIRFTEDNRVRFKASNYDR